MNKTDGQKIIEFIEGYYHRKLESSEVKTLAEELKSYDYDSFTDSLKTPLLRRVSYFTIAELHKIIEEDKELERYKRSLGVKSLNELYEN